MVHVEVFAHAIWTVGVVSHPVVTDHHRQYSLELEYVEARVVKVAEVTAHANVFLVTTLSL